MKRYLVLTGCFLFIGILAVLNDYSFGQEDMTVVQDSGFAETMRPEAIFEHDTHNEAAGIEDCTVCHHAYDEAGKLIPDESSEDQQCSECHGENKLELTKRFHLNCKGCHLDKKAGPVLCGECHRRQ